jgi:hypothetical protein
MVNASYRLGSDPPRSTHLVGDEAAGVEDNVRASRVSVDVAHPARRAFGELVEVGTLGVQLDPVLGHRREADAGPLKGTGGRSEIRRLDLDGGVVAVPR